MKVWMTATKNIPINLDNEKIRVASKPVIYVYPTKEQAVNINVTPLNGFSFTYPSYSKNGWNVTAHPNGNIICNDKHYNYLFWEGPLIDISEFDLTNGFYVHSDTVVQFLEHTLTKVGLTDTEQADFITYWAPQLILNDLNFIHFDFNEGYKKLIAQLEVTPKPETLIRVFMMFKPASKVQQTKPQIIPKVNRKGFTVVEWGGSSI
jgi:hypothetical protein